MSDKSKHHLPDFIIQDLNADNAMSAKEMESVERIWESASSFKYPEAGTAAKWEGFKAGLMMQPEVVAKKPLFHMFRWVAAAVIVLGVSIGIYQYNNFSNSEGYVAHFESGKEIKAVTLPDGSKIVLNANSIINVDAINKYKRALTLVKGEVFFSVAHDGRPFVVSTEKGAVEVLGTEFNIDNYPGKTFSVFLKKGKINWHNAEETISMIPGQKLLAKANGKIELISTDDVSETAWMESKLVFENTSLEDIIKALESKYNVTFEYDQTLAKEKYNLSIDDLSAEQAAELLSKTTSSKITIR
ncbi:MAG TPA: FecR domain-containing protein [Bacteroidia bacterium]